MSETTLEDHLIILHEFLAGNKSFAMSSSIQAQVNCSRVRVNCSQVSVKLHLSCTVGPELLTHMQLLLTHIHKHTHTRTHMHVYTQEEYLATFL